VTAAIPGTARPEHMKDNLAGGQAPLPDASQRKKLAAYFDSL
jgi:aryl-alcohol dehydrogenase-like predicted oxidoreductase